MSYEKQRFGTQGAQNENMGSGAEGARLRENDLGLKLRYSYEKLGLGLPVQALPIASWDLGLKVNKCLLGCHNPGSSWGTEQATIIAILPTSRTLRARNPKESERAKESAKSPKGCPGLWFRGATESHKSAPQSLKTVHNAASDSFWTLSGSGAHSFGTLGLPGTGSPGTTCRT